MLDGQRPQSFLGVLACAGREMLWVEPRLPVVSQDGVTAKRRGRFTDRGSVVNAGRDEHDVVGIVDSPVQFDRFTDHPLERFGHWQRVSFAVLGGLPAASSRG